MVLDKLPPDAFVLLTILQNPASTSTFLTSDSCLGAVGISRNLGNVPPSIGSSLLVSANEGCPKDSGVGTTV